MNDANRHWIKDWESADRGRGAVVGGGIAGLSAGIVMLLGAVGHAVVSGTGASFPLRNIAALVYGADALGPGAGIVGAGLLIHLLTAVVLGVIFTVLIRPESGPWAVAGQGAVFGISVWAVSTFILLPAINPILYESYAGIRPISWFVLHLLYGLSLFPAAALARRFARPLKREPRYERRKPAWYEEPRV